MRDEGHVSVSRTTFHASFDFVQDEDEFDVPSTIYLILSEVEGRTMMLLASRRDLRIPR
jgi:hypothetical protein